MNENEWLGLVKDFNLLTLLFLSSKEAPHHLADPNASPDMFGATGISGEAKVKLMRGGGYCLFPSRASAQRVGLGLVC